MMAEASFTRRSARSRAENDEDLHEENLWLVQQLAISDASARQAHDRVRQLRHRVRHLEQQLCDERSEWQATLQRKERVWMDEYDRNMQSLLQIIAHHEQRQREAEGTMHQMKKDLENRCRVVLTTEVATQTEDTESDSQCEHAIMPSAPSKPVKPQARPAEIPTIEPPVLEDPSPSIHEQYVALTMEKLLDQLRQSNERPTTSTATTAAYPESVSFRDLVRRRLSNPSPTSADNLKLPFLGLNPRCRLNHAGLSSIDEATDHQCSPPVA